jgi:hypothetical protein
MKVYSGFGPATGLARPTYWKLSHARVSSQARQAGMT